MVDREIFCVYEKVYSLLYQLIYSLLVPWSLGSLGLLSGERQSAVVERARS